MVIHKSILKWKVRIVKVLTQNIPYSLPPTPPLFFSFHEKNNIIWKKKKRKNTFFPFLSISHCWNKGEKRKNERERNKMKLSTSFTVRCFLSDQIYYSSDSSFTQVVLQVTLLKFNNADSFKDDQRLQIAYKHLMHLEIKLWAIQ